MSWGEKTCIYIDREDKPCTPLKFTCNTNCDYYKKCEDSEPESLKPVEKKPVFELKEITARDLHLGEIFLLPVSLHQAAVSRMLMKRDAHFYGQNLIGLPGQPTEEDFIRELIKVCGWVVVGNIYSGPTPKIQCQKIIKKSGGLKYSRILLSHIKLITTSKIVEFNKNEPAGNSADNKL
jgi:hypothetical protein